MEFSKQEYWNGLLFPSPGFNPAVHLSLEAFAIVRKKKKKKRMIFKFLPRSVASHLLTSTSYGWFHLASSLTRQRGPCLLPTKTNPVPNTGPCTLALTLHWIQSPYSRTWVMPSYKALCHYCWGYHVCQGFQHKITSCCPETLAWGLLRVRGVWA